MRHFTTSVTGIPFSTLCTIKIFNASSLEPGVRRVQTRASLPLDAIRRPRDMPLWKQEHSLNLQIMPQGSHRAAGTREEADRDAGDQPVQVGAPG